ncbi:MAG: aminotransferase class IV [Flavobacteriales bacterium]|nr:aminotransferase class IV [Flavobacteriales bacterium]
MRQWVNFNGQLMPADEPVITLDNRAFHYGDGLFESMRVIDGRTSFLPTHWARLTEGCKVLRIDVPTGLTPETLEKQIGELVERNGTPNARCRLSVFRHGDGHYRPGSHKGAYTIELYPMEQQWYALNERGLTVDIYPEIRKPVDPLSVHKTINCQLYIMASLWSEARGLDDCLLQNERGNIIENSSGNLFIVSNGVLYTPSLSDGCVGGVMRMQMINLALHHGIKVYECSLNPQNLLAADELFFTNAVRGIQWVSTYRTKRYTHKHSEQLNKLLIEKLRTN